MYAVIEKEATDRLSAEDFSIYRSGSFDFCIVSKSSCLPLFAVEFDGPYHSNPEQVRRDISKNTLCKKAKLPLLRIGPNDIAEYERWTVLDFMLYRHALWRQEKNNIDLEVQERVSQLSPEAIETLVAEQDPCLDSYFIFALRYPLPAIKTLKRRLLQRFRIAPTTEHYLLQRSPDFLFDSLPSRQYTTDDGYATCTYGVTVRSPSSNCSDPLVTFERSSQMRYWLPLATDIPNPNIHFGHLTEEAVREFERRLRSLWPPHIPGIDPSNIAENFAEYLALRALEDWAEQKLRAA